MKRQKGVALLTVVLVMAILVLVVGVSIILAKTEVSTSQNNSRAIQALALAESGIDYAIAQLRDSNTISPRINPAVFPKPTELNPITTTTTYLPTMSTTVTVIRGLLDAQQGTETATVTAYSKIPDSGPNYPAANRALRVVFSYAGGGGTSSPTVPISNYWKRPLTANGRIQATGNHFDVDAPALTGAGVQSNAAITGNSVSITGNYIDIAAGNPDVGYMQGAGASLVGNQVIATKGVVPPDPVPSMDFTYWANLAKPAGSVLMNASQINSMDVVTGPVWVNGNLTITRNNIVIYGPLYVLGNLTLTANNVSLNDVIYATGNLNLTSNTIREPTGSTKGLTMVAGNDFVTTGNDVTVDGIGGFAILAQQNVRVTSNTFTLDGLLYAGGNFTSTNNTITLNGAFAVLGNMTLTTNTIDVIWKDFSGSGSTPPPGTGGDNPGAGTGTGQWDLFNWQEIEAIP